MWAALPALFTLGWFAVAAAPANNPVTESCEHPQGQPDWPSAMSYDARWAQDSLVIDFEVAPCFHAYPADSTRGQPLHLELHAAKGLRAKGPAAYPKGKKEQGPFGDRVVLRGRGQIRLPVQRSQPQAQTLKATLHFHACTDRACGPPQHVKLAVSVPAA